MIQVNELTKIYKSRKSGKCVALDHVSFTLPDRGFIFIIGKSGSGKTTLLSLLGGLDTITSGEITVNGRQIGKFGLKEQVYYRNSAIGFIFQDFHLIDTLTIYENVALALGLQGEESDERVLKALSDTDLAEYGNRYPRELSGGQKQRVAIARALVKRPSIILADEPTGNLDSRTTEQILGLLKELSEEKLVVIVSHNLSDAERYADEILELSGGKILRHVKRNRAFDRRLRIEDGSLVIPYGERFTDENLCQVNAELEGCGVKSVRQDGDRFLPYDGRAETAEVASPLEKKHLNAKSTLKLAARFAKSSTVRTCVYAVIFAAILTVLMLSRLVMSFNGGEVIAAEMAKRDLSCSAFIKNTSAAYDSVDETRLVDVEEGDLQAFAGYNGKAYPLINYRLLLMSGSTESTVLQKKPQIKSDPFSIQSTSGTLITEESFVEKVFGSYTLCEQADKVQDYGVYITDFDADIMKLRNPTLYYSYKSVTGRLSKISTHCLGYVNGVIDTGYKERYKDLLERLYDTKISQEELKKLSESDECLAFYDEVSQFLNISYSFNPNFIEDVIASDIRQIASIGLTVFEYGGRKSEIRNGGITYSTLHNSVPLSDNEMIIRYDTYNTLFGSIFGDNYTPSTMGSFTPREVKFSYYLICDENKSRVKYETTLTIKALTNENSSIRFNLADNVFHELQRIEMFTCGYYFDSSSDASLLFNAANERGFIPLSTIGSSITTMTRAVGVFSRFFVVVFIMLCAALLLIMVQFELKSIRDKMRDIGIMKALGARDIDLIVIFGLQVLALGLMTIALFILGSYLFVGLANKLLVLSLSEFAKTTMVLDLAFLTVKWNYVLQCCVLAAAILTVSFLVPMLRLRYIKPTNVIKAKE